MNIFFLDRDPELCAKYHNDKHVVKMVVEYAQLLSTAHRVWDGKPYWDKTANGRRIKRWKMFQGYHEHNLYKASHVNHPSSIWTRASVDHYVWLHKLWLHLAKEYEYRYKREHLTYQKLKDIVIKYPRNIKANGWVDPPPAMPVEAKVMGDAIASYHNYYRNYKSSFNNFKGRDVPHFLDETNDTQELPESKSLSTFVPNMRKTLAA